MNFLQNSSVKTGNEYTRGAEKIVKKVLYEMFCQLSVCDSLQQL